MRRDEIDISELLGKTFSDIQVSSNLETINFVCATGETYQMYHDQGCCESVTVDDIIGVLDDLIGAPLLMAEKVTNENENPEGFTKEYQDSFTWTFYKFATIKGYVTIRWYGESNGYYSEEVTFAKV